MKLPIATYSNGQKFSMGINSVWQCNNNLKYKKKKLEIQKNNGSSQLIAHLYVSELYLYIFPDYTCLHHNA